MSSNPYDYSTDLIQDPGKFEGETGMTLYYWELVMLGDGEDMSPDYGDEEGWELYGPVFSFFEVSEDESKAFKGEVESGDTVVVWENDQGFVNLVAYKTRETALKDLGLEE